MLLEDFFFCETIFEGFFQSNHQILLLSDQANQQNEAVEFTKACIKFFLVIHDLPANAFAKSLDTGSGFFLIDNNIIF